MRRTNARLLFLRLTARRHNNSNKATESELKQTPLPRDLQNDVDEIGRSSLVPSLLETVTLATGMGFAAVARVTESRWVTCCAVDKISFGLKPGDELVVESTLCHEVRQSDAEVVISDVKNDLDYHDHHTPATYDIQSYISVPIYKKDGSFFGTLCAIDPEPRNLKDDDILAMFRLFAKMIGDSLETDAKLVETQQFIEEKTQMAELQQTFIAILAHDLRNPISVLNSGLRILKRTDLTPAVLNVIALMNTSLDRMANLVENLLDQARHHHDGHIIIERDDESPLEPTIRQIVDEMNAVSPEQVIDCDIQLPENVNCDRDRIAQMLSNLLGNAITHGAADRPIKVTAKFEDGAFLLSVANEGDMIPQEHLPGLFLPFDQGSQRQSREGLGLGLFISSEIAKAHGGTLDVESSERETTFTFRMPHS